MKYEITVILQVIADNAEEAQAKVSEDNRKYNVIVDKIEKIGL